MDYYGLMPFFHRLWLLLVFLCPLGAQAQTPDSNTAAPVSSALDSELFYQLLLGELNARDGEPGTGYSLLLDAARKTGDSRLYQAKRRWQQRGPGGRPSPPPGKPIAICCRS